MAAFAAIDLCEDAPTIGRVVDIVEQVDGLVDASQFHDRACPGLEGRSLLRKERTSSEACTVPSFREPATRSMSSQCCQMRFALT